MGMTLQIIYTKQSQITAINDFVGTKTTVVVKIFSQSFSYVYEECKSKKQHIFIMILAFFGAKRKNGQSLVAYNKASN